MESLRALERRLVAVENAVLVLLAILLVSLGFVQVVLRGFERGILWADSFLRHLVLWTGFLGGCVAAAGGRHFAMDAGLRALGPRARAVARAFCQALAAGVCGVMAFAAWRFVAQEYETGGVAFTVGGAAVRNWALETILPAGFALLALHFCLRAALGGEAAE